MLVIGESGYFDTISMGLFFFHCIVLQISMRFEMTFLIKNKMEKNKLVNFGPTASWVKQTCYLIEFTFNHTFLFRWGEKKLF